MSNTSLKLSPRDLDRAELLWDCFDAAVRVIGADEDCECDRAQKGSGPEKRFVADRIKRFEEVLTRCDEAVKERKLSDADVGRKWLKGLEPTAEALRREAEGLSSPGTQGQCGWEPLGDDRRQALLKEMHREVTEALLPVFRLMFGQWEVWKLPDPTTGELSDYEAGCTSQWWRDEARNVRERLASARSKLRAGPASGFAFGHGEALYDGRPLKLPAGFAVKVLRKLVDNLGRVVAFKELDGGSLTREASERLRTAVMKIGKALRTTRAPHRVENVKGAGYKLL
jgi:hypothetical protein